MRTVLTLPTLALILASATLHTRAEGPPFREVGCEGVYSKHLQGVTHDGDRAIYWSFTDALVKTDPNGKILKKVPVGDHHGDLCYHGGKVYVAVNFGEFNEPAGKADSWVYVYDADTLKELARHKAPEVVHGAGGMAEHDGRFYVVGGLPNGVKENYVYEYDDQFRFQRRHVLDSGWTLLGIQTVTFADGQWWFGCYGNPAILLVADEDFQNVRRFEFDTSLGLIGLVDGRFLAAKGPRDANNRCRGVLAPAKLSAAGGLEWIRP